MLVVAANGAGGIGAAGMDDGAAAVVAADGTLEAADRGSALLGGVAGTP